MKIKVTRVCIKEFELDEYTGKKIIKLGILDTPKFQKLLSQQKVINGKNIFTVERIRQ